MARLKTKAIIMFFSRKYQHTSNVNNPSIISILEVSAASTAANLLFEGKVIAIPTDTIYGIAASTQNNYGLKKLYEIKKRDLNKPLSICVSDTSEIKLWGETSHLNESLLEDLLPGPVTIVLKRKGLLNSFVNPNTDLIGIRIPNTNFVQALSRLCTVPIALTSANISFEQSPIEINDFIHLWPKLDAIFDGGVISNSPLQRAGSTVVDLSEPGHYNIIREGSALKDTLATLSKFNLKVKVKH